MSCSCLSLSVAPDIVSEVSLTSSAFQAEHWANSHVGHLICLCFFLPSNKKQTNNQTVNILEAINRNPNVSVATASNQDCASVSLRIPCGGLGLGILQSVISFFWIIFTQAPALSHCRWLFDLQLRSAGHSVLVWTSLESLEVTQVWPWMVTSAICQPLGRLQFLCHSAIHLISDKFLRKSSLRTRWTVCVRECISTKIRPSGVPRVAPGWANGGRDTSWFAAKKEADGTRD